jgi:hypothetical protein
MTVSAISRINYYELILPTLSETQLRIYNIIKARKKGICSYHLIQILGKEHHKFSGRLTELVLMGLIKVDADRIVEINGSYYGVWISNLDEEGNLIDTPND